MAVFLRKHATLLGLATMSGRLYSLGAYPAAVFDPEAATRVCGELFKMRDATNLLPELDLYEGIEDRPDQPAEYRRAVVEVTFGSSSVYCWTYLCKEENSALKQVPPDEHNQVSWYGICP